MILKNSFMIKNLNLIFATLFIIVMVHFNLYKNGSYNYHYQDNIMLQYYYRSIMSKLHKTH